MKSSTISERMKKRWALVKAGKLPKPARKSPDDPTYRPAIACLVKPITRETPNVYQRRAIIFTAAPLPGQNQTVIALRLKGSKTQYIRSLSDIYRDAALQFARKESLAKKAARKAGVPWRVARKQFVRENTLPVGHHGSKQEATA